MAAKNGIAVMESTITDNTVDGIRTAVRMATIELGGDYEGWRATMRVNPPARLFDDFRSGEEERLDAALKGIVLEWNFVDDDGAPLTMPKDGLDWKEVPWDLKRALVDGYGKAMMARLDVPKETSTPSEPGEQSGT